MVNKWVAHMFRIWLSQVRCGYISSEGRQKKPVLLVTFW
jgi:hypothetical protein